MRKLLVTATTAAVLTAAVSTPAWAAAPEAPTDVQISWADGKVRVTWQDNGEPNMVRAEYVDADRTVLLANRTATQTNEASISGAAFEDRDRIRILVTSYLTGQGSSTAATSPLFDARVPVFPFIEDADLLADQSVRLRWTQPTVQDLTPNDPLDRPVDDQYLGLQLGAPGAPVEKITVPVGSTTYTVPARPRPWSITMYAGNEWKASYIHEAGSGPSYQRTVSVGTVQAVLSGVPARMAYGLWMPMRTTLTSNLPGEYFDAVQLQARPNSAAAWKTYGRYSAYIKSFDTGLGSLGGRQYRIWVPALKKSDWSTITLAPAVSTAAKSSRTFSRMLTTKFQPASLKVGQTTKLNVAVRPEVDMKAALQQWDGKHWRYARALPLTKGRASVAIKATRRGTTKFRIATPAVTVNGLPVDAATSTPFTLTIR
ncbi:hypothetical protein ACFTSF_05275 [Kribbella sp. NPDC056951]|uniref:hypothetical protein n=1 Tax=Kribbella sp. NPDC056951 TaxID=3345978 RepID=UPI00363E9EA3